MAAGAEKSKSMLAGFCCWLARSQMMMVGIRIFISNEGDLRLNCICSTTVAPLVSSH